MVVTVALCNRAQISKVALPLQIDSVPVAFITCLISSCFVSVLALADSTARTEEWPNGKPL